MPDPLPQSILCPVLIGRDPQVAALTLLLEQERTGHGQIALISGEAGIGKSRLVVEIKKLATTQGMSVVQGNCFEPDRMLPYAPLLDLLRTLPRETSLPAELAALLSGQPTTLAEEPEPAKRRLFATLTTFLSEHTPQFATHNSQLMILEDLHWCDDTSLEFLFRFVRNLATAPICLLLTLRSDEIHPALAHFLAELERRHLSSEIALPRFTELETQAVIRTIFA